MSDLSRRPSGLHTGFFTKPIDVSRPSDAVAKDVAVGTGTN
jgi:hypothetical protein